MLEISEELKTLYKTDYLPYRSEPINKQLDIYFPKLDLHIYNPQIVADTFTIDESICSNEDIVYGSCESNCIKFRVANITKDLTGEEFKVTQTVDGGYTMNLGTYVVDSCKLQDNRIFKDIIAYDNMRKFDIDVASWWNGLTFPLPLKSLREQLCQKVGVTCLEQTLVNDSMQVTKTIEPSTLKARDLLKKICELSGGFGNMTRDNKFKVIVLYSHGLYPSETLYPSEDLYPSESNVYFEHTSYKTLHYEEYLIEQIDKLQIRQEDGDIGCIVGDGDNSYVIEGNFLTYGKNTTELTTIANNVFNLIKRVYYRPCEAELACGLPYIEVGDAIAFATKADDMVEAYVFNRTLSGIQSLKDKYSCTGNQIREVVKGVATEIIQLQGKTAKIQKSVDEVSSELSDFRTSTNTNFTQTSEAITLEANRAKKSEEELSAAISLTAEGISTKVEKNGVISSINQSAESVIISADKINFNGAISANGNFKVTTNGDLEATSANLNNAYFTNGIYYEYRGLRFPIFEVPSQGILQVANSATHCKFMGSIEARNAVFTNVSVSGNSVLTSSTYATDLRVSLLSSPTYKGACYLSFQNTIGDENVPTIGWVKARQASDERLKEDFKELDIEHAYMSLKPLQYRFKNGVSNNLIHFGFKANHIEKLLPSDRYDLIEYDSEIVTKGEKTYVDGGVYRINYENMHAMHVAMIQKLSLKIDELENRIIELEKGAE